MIQQMTQLLVCALTIFASAPLPSVAPTTVSFSDALFGGTVTVTITKDGKSKDIAVTLPKGTKAGNKRDEIRRKLNEEGVTAEDTTGSDGNPGIRLASLPDGATVTVDEGTTGETSKIEQAKAPGGTISFEGAFSTTGPTGDPAVFVAGIISDVGELFVEYSPADSELEGLVDGSTIAEGLFMMLAWEAVDYGAAIVLDGEHLLVFFDPHVTVGHAGVIFGTTSPSAGCSGSLVTAARPRRSGIR